MKKSLEGGAGIGKGPAMWRRDSSMVVLIGCVFQCGYLDGLRSQLGGWTQKVKSWYWGRPLVS